MLVIVHPDSIHERNYNFVDGYFKHILKLIDYRNDTIIISRLYRKFPDQCPGLQEKISLFYKEIKNRDIKVIDEQSTTDQTGNLGLGIIETYQPQDVDICGCFWFGHCKMCCEETAENLRMFGFNVHPLWDYISTMDKVF